MASSAQTYAGRLRTAADPAGVDRRLRYAFSMVRTLLDEKPRTIHQLFRDGIANGAVPVDAPGLSPAESSKSGAVANRAKKGRNMVEEQGSDASNGHPFVSVNYLKRRILPVLKSHKLIEQRIEKIGPKKSNEYRWTLIPQPISGTSPRASAASAAQSPAASESPSPSSLSESSTAASTSSAPQPRPSSTTWDVEEHWRRLTSPPAEVGPDDRPSKVYLELQQHLSAQRNANRELALDNPRNPSQRRTEREIWAWKDRHEMLTTTLEREHLNSRRARARPAKERRAAGLIPSGASDDRYRAIF